MGIAEQLFLKKTGKPLSPMEEKAWPFLWECVSKGIFSEVDLYFAQKVLGLSPDDQNLAALVCHLFAMSRMGHLCVLIEGKTINPFFKDGEEDLLEKLKTAILEGWKLFPQELVDESCDSYPTKPLFRSKNALYLQRNWVFETRYVDHVNRLINAAPLPLQDVEIPGPLNEEQSDAVRKALRNTLTLVTGGPGTGKTFTAAQIVSALLRSLAPETKENYQIVLAAPTGKAAAHLEMNLRKHVGHLNQIKCGTIHSLLKVRSSEDFNTEGGWLPADLVIVDECSMIDVRLFSYFLASLKVGTRVVLMGDMDQLPPVESGSLFADTVFAAAKGQRIPCTVLKRCMRSDQQEILGLASSINEGDSIEALRKIQAGKDSVRRVDLGLSCGDPSKILMKIFEHVKDRFPLPFGIDKICEGLCEKMDDFRILCCVRKGPLGVDALNQMIAEGFMEKVAPGECLAMPILITKTDYSLGLCNGETGILVRHRKDRPMQGQIFEREDYALFPDRKREGSLLTFPLCTIPSFEYAYCLSVHKSQGSEFDAVLLLAPEGSETFGKEVLYTAVTRAKRLLEIDGSERVLCEAIEHSSRKISGLHVRL